MNEHNINFRVSKEDHKEIFQIAKTFIEKFPEYPDSFLTLVMDLTACHANGNPLDLKAMGDAVADIENNNRHAQDVIHDIYGIRRNINRHTGKLDNFFVPRFSKQD